MAASNIAAWPDVKYLGFAGDALIDIIILWDVSIISKFDACITITDRIMDMCQVEITTMGGHLMARQIFVQTNFENAITHCCSGICGTLETV